MFFTANMYDGAEGSPPSGILVCALICSEKTQRKTKRVWGEEQMGRCCAADQGHAHVCISPRSCSHWLQPGHSHARYSV